ncbi:MAG: hypothetical protein M9965_08980 [Anaerolineae bacterium]|nr:hypothetical protein [Anaerolineae bacterium]
MTLNSSKLRIIVSGLIAQYPLGGVTWDYLQYVLGLAQQGHDVYYIEDTGQWPYNPEDRGTGKGYEYNVRYLSGIMQKFGLEERWAYCFPWETQWFGMSDRQRRESSRVCGLLINIGINITA